MSFPALLRAQTKLWTGRLIAGHNATVARCFRARALPYGYWNVIRSVAFAMTGTPNVLRGEKKDLTAGGSVPIEVLRDDFHGEILGDFALDADTVVCLWGLLAGQRPKCILEFGSGLSTVMLARYACLRAKHGEVVPKIISVDQGADAIGRTTMLLKRAGLEDYATVLLGPIDVEGRYQVPEDRMKQVLGDLRVDCFLIDGPFGPKGCRFHTLGEFRHYGAPGAVWLMDDSFRDSEMSVLRQWSEDPGIAVDGIYAVGKGLAVGRLRNR